MKKKSRILWLRIIIAWNVLLLLELKFNLLSNIMSPTVYKWGIIIITGLMFGMLIKVTYFTFIPKILKTKRNVKKAYTIYILAHSSLGILLFDILSSIIKNS